MPHCLRRLLLLHGGSLPLNQLPAAWQAVYGTPLPQPPPAFGVHPLQQLVRACPQACQLRLGPDGSLVANAELTPAGLEELVQLVWQRALAEGRHVLFEHTSAELSYFLAARCAGRRACALAGCRRGRLRPSRGGAKAGTAVGVRVSTIGRGGSRARRTPQLHLL